MLVARLILIAILIPGVLQAHDDRPAPVVSLRVAPNASMLDIVARIPSRVLPDPTLPRDSQGRLTGGGYDDALRLLSRDLVNGLEPRQQDQPLPTPTLAIGVVDDGAVVEVRLGYPIRPEASGISVRVAPYRGLIDIVPIEVVLPEDARRRYVVGGTAERILFLPGRFDAALEFTTRSARLLAGQWAIVLFLLALTLPIGAVAPDTRRELAVLLASQAIGAAAGVAGVSSSLAPVVAASVVLIAVLRRLLLALNASNAQQVGTSLPLVVAFGVSAGLALGGELGAGLALAGAHVPIALAVSAVVLTLGQWWLWSLLSVAGRLVVGYGLPARALLITGTVFITHEALHAVAAHAPAAASWLGLTPVQTMELLTVCWMAVLLVSGARHREARV